MFHWKEEEIKIRVFAGIGISESRGKAEPPPGPSALGGGRSRRLLPCRQVSPEKAGQKGAACRRRAARRHCPPVGSASALGSGGIRKVIGCLPLSQLVGLHRCSAPGSTQLLGGAGPVVRSHFSPAPTGSLLVLAPLLAWPPLGAAVL